MNLYSKFCADRKGNVAVLFSLFAVPVMLVTGSAVDYSQALQIRTRIQMAADAAAMAAATAPAATQQERIDMASNVFQANARLADFGVSVQPTASVAPGNISVSASVDVPTTFMAIAAIDSITVEASGKVQTAGKKLELAVMLDVTGSMGGSKITDMKWAAKDMMDIVMPVGGPDSSTRIALVPFSNRVNAGNFAAAVTGMNPTYTTTSRGRGRGRGRGGRTTTSYLVPCVTERQGNYRFNDDAPASGRYVGPYNPSSSTSGQYNSNGSCSIPTIKPLSSDREMLRSHIDSFTAAGGTAGHLGTAWAWYMLSPKWNSIWPVDSQSVAYEDEENIKAAVLMTDGDYNTDYSSGYSSTSMARELCTRMKAQGIVVYTIGFQISSNSTARDTLVQCASSDSHYLFPYNGDDLRAAFRSIGQALSYAQGSAHFTE